MNKPGFYCMSFTTKQQGFSLIELLVAMFIAAVIFAGVVNTLLASKSAYLYDEEVAYIQENSRFALGYIARDVREAGYFGGCNINAASVANALDLSADVDQADLFSTTPIEGFENGGVFPATFAADVYPNTDAFIIRKMDSDSVALTGTSGVNNNVSPDNSFLSHDDVIIIVSPECTQVAIYEATQGPSSNKIQHNQGADGHNCSSRVLGNFNCTGCPPNGVCSGSMSGAIPPGSAVSRFIAKAYFVGVSTHDPDSRSLYVRTMKGSTSSEELVGGVEDMQVLYGVDTNASANPDGDADRYYTADVVPDWNRVVSVKLTLVLRSRNQVLGATTTKTMPTLGSTYTDKYLYQEVSTVIKLRNAALPANP